MSNAWKTPAQHLNDTSKTPKQHLNNTWKSEWHLNNTWKRTSMSLDPWWSGCHGHLHRATLQFVVSVFSVLTCSHLNALLHLLLVKLGPTVPLPDVSMETCQLKLNPCQCIQWNCCASCEYDGSDGYSAAVGSGVSILSNRSWFNLNEVVVWR